MEKLTSVQDFIEDSAPTKIAICSFFLGSVLLILFIITKELALIYIGFLYILSALFINLIALMILIYNLIINFHNRKKIMLEITILLANIPIVILYILLIKQVI
jgi:hypothetical protein